MGMAWRLLLIISLLAHQLLVLLLNQVTWAHKQDNLLVLAPQPANVGTQAGQPSGASLNHANVGTQAGQPSGLAPQPVNVGTQAGQPSGALLNQLTWAHKQDNLLVLPQPANVGTQAGQPSGAASQPA